MARLGFYRHACATTDTYMDDSLRVVEDMGAYVVGKKALEMLFARLRLWLE